MDHTDNEVFAYASACGLEIRNTGGNITFPVLQHGFVCGRKLTYVVSDTEDINFTPELLTSPALVTMYFTAAGCEDVWMNGITFPFASAKAAIDWVSQSGSQCEITESDPDGWWSTDGGKVGG